MNYKKVIVEAGRKLCERSLTVGTWGNISCRDPEKGLIYLTPSGMNYDQISEEDIVVFNKQGEVVQGTRKPSIEKDLHLKIYENRNDVQAVLHTHSVYSSVFAVTAEEIPPVSEDFVQIVGDRVECADYALPGTEELAENAVEELDSRNAVLLVNHGAVAVGSDMDTAFKVSDVLEKTARIYIYSKSIGEAQIIPDEDIEAMQDFAKNSYGQ